MPKTLRYSEDLRDQQTNLMSRLLASGTVCLYAGPRPEMPEDDPPGDARLIAELRFSTPAFEQPVKGRAEGPLEGDYAKLTARLSWFRVYSADGRALFDGSIGTDGTADLNVDRLEVEEDARIRPGRFVYTSPRS